MSQEIEIRDSLPSDAPAIERVYPEAFPDEDLLPLVRDLLAAEQGVVSLVAIVGRALAGHVAFTMGHIGGRAEGVALLAPLAVAPDRQRQGIGSALVREGLRHLRAEGTIQVYVLGDPAYYGRFGFEPDDGVVPPYPLPEEWRPAWQSVRLREGSQALRGTLSLPEPWQRPALWAP
jgi:putative acetyltransferase